MIARIGDWALARRLLTAGPQRLRAAVGTAIQQDFPADKFTAELIPAAKTNVWSFLFSPKKSLSYRLVRASEGRRFRVEFDLTKPIPAPPAPWGHP